MSYPDRNRYVHLRGENDVLLPQDISFGVYPRDFDVQLDAMRRMLEHTEGPEEEAAIRKAMQDLSALIDKQEVYVGSFVPITEGNWNEYVTKSVSRSLIVARHLTDKAGKRLYTDDDAPYLKPHAFVTAAYEAILEASEFTRPFEVQAELIKETMLLELKKSRARIVMNRMTEMAALQAAASPQGTSLPVDSTSSPGIAQDLRESK